MIPSGTRSVHAVATATKLLLPAGFAALVLLHGVPMLRHDWLWPRERSEAWSYLTLMTSGWQPLGLGSPNANPTTYFAAVPAAMLALTFGPAVALYIVLYAIGVLCTWSVTRLSVLMRVGTLSCVSAQAIALFNPWVWNKVVAGHIFMLLAYGAIMGLCVTLALEPKRTIRAALMTALTSVQLQFYLPAMVIAAVFCVRRRQPLPFIAGLIVGAPTILGLVCDRSSLDAIPYLLTWQRVQSVPPMSGALLSGYASDYLGTLAPVVLIGMTGLVVLAIAGALIRLSKWSVGVGLATGAILLFAAGADEPLGGLYLIFVAAFKWSGVYRELYDLLGAVALGYVCLSLRAVRHVPRLEYLFAFCGATVVSLWISHPVASFWPKANAVPLLAVQTATNMRYALFPAFQPLSYVTSGSGADPDSVLRENNQTPVNEYLPAYPEDVALAEFQRRRATVGLASLSVSALYERAKFRGSDSPIAGNPVQQPPYQRDVALYIRDPLPELGISTAPETGSLTSNFGAGNILIRDVANSHAIVNRIAAPNATNDPRAGWVSLRLVETRYPDFAQPLGGAITESTDALTIPRGTLGLVRVRGELFSAGGALLAKDMSTYGWVSLRGATEVRCAGLCAVAATGWVPANVPLDPPRHRVATVSFEQPFPWLALARIAPRPSDANFLRYNVRYERGWTAILGGRVLTHVRVDGVTNGWVLPKNVYGNVLIVDVIAMCQFVFEIVGLLCLFALAILSLRAEYSLRSIFGRFRDAIGANASW